MAVVTIYAGARSNTPADAQDLTWDEVADELEALANRPTEAPRTAVVDEQKKAMLAWAPHALVEGKRRGAKNVEAVTLLALDVDAGDPDAIAGELERNGVAGLIYESPSSTPDAPRFRVVSPVADPIAPDMCRETRLAFAEALGLEPGCGVEACCDPSRLFFAGRLHDTPERRVWRVEGDPINAAELPPASLEWGSGKAVAADLAPLGELPPADEGIARALGDWRAHRGRKFDICGAVGGLMRRMGFSRAKCAAELQAWLPVDEPGVDVDAGIRWACAAWAKPAEDVSGHDALATLLGEQHATVVEDAAFASTWAGRAAKRRARAPRFVAGDAPAGDAPFATSEWDGDDEPIEYYCEGLRLAPSQGKISLIGGLPGAGKGPLAGYLATCFALGTPAFGQFACRKSRVLLLDCEGVRLSKRRIRRMTRALEREPRELSGALHTRDVSADDVMSEWFYQSLEAERAEVIILDSYTSAMLTTGADTNKPEFAVLAKMLGSLGVLVLAVAHARKPGERGERPTLADIAGSFALAAMAATAVSAWKPDEQNDNIVRVGCMRAPETGFSTFDVEFEDVENDGLAVSWVDPGARLVDESAMRVAAYVQIYSWLRAQDPRPRTAGDMHAANRVGAPERTFERWCTTVGEALVSSELAVLEEMQRGARVVRRYTLAEHAPERLDFDADGNIVAPPKRPSVGARAVGKFSSNPKDPKRLR